MRSAWRRVCVAGEPVREQVSSLASCSESEDNGTARDAIDAIYAGHSCGELACSRTKSERRGDRCECAMLPIVVLAVRASRSAIQADG